MSLILAAVGMVLGAVALVHGVAWLLLNLLALPRPRCRQAGAPLRFGVIVPAHNEAASIATTVTSIRADSYEPAPVLLVVADNCVDATAALAERAGARVLARFDDAHRGKSFALDAGIDWMERGPETFDVYVVLDADTTVQPGFFSAIAASFAAGANVAQARYDVADPAAAVSRLRALAFALVHYARPLGASRLRLGMGLKGNGMAFRSSLVANGMPGSGITEDAAATLDLAGRGIGAWFVPLAVVHGAMAERYGEAAVQDRRWEGGRLGLIPLAFATSLRALIRGHWRAAGSAMDVAALPLTVVVGAGCLAFALAALGFGPILLPVTALAALGLSIGTGWVAARIPVRDLAVLAHAPRFIAYKLATLARLALRGAPTAWERTKRGVEP